MSSSEISAASAPAATSTTVHPEDIALSFKNLGISSLFPPKPLLCNVSGYVVKGGITASKLFSRETCTIGGISN